MQTLNLLSSSIDLPLSPVNREILEQHLIECAGCRQQAEAMRAHEHAVKSALQGLLIEPSALTRSVLALEAAGVDAPLARPPRFALAAIAAVTLVAIGLAWALRHPADVNPVPAGEPITARTPPSRFQQSGGVSCEVDPRGVDVRWERISASAVTGFAVERHDGHGGQKRFEVTEPRLLDTSIQPGEEYFYVVREQPREEPMAYVGMGTFTLDPAYKELRVRFIGATGHVALILVSFDEGGQTYSRAFPTQIGEKIGGVATVTGRGQADFQTPYVLLGIDWDAERTVLDPSTGTSRQVQSQAARLATPEGAPLTLWLRGD